MLIKRQLMHGAELLEMVKFQHTVFALPFALTGMLLAAQGIPKGSVVFWIVVCSIFARTAAMAFNRWADADLDGRNPRTATRSIPAGRLSSRYVLAVAIVSAALFVAAAGMINRLTLVLSPVALLVLFGYSYCKRFTPLAHFVLGLALAIAPAGAWIAVTGTLAVPPLLLAAAVLTWTAGFDIIYALMDLDFDRTEGLFSVPARYGAKNALWLSRVLHVLSIGALCGTGLLLGLGTWYFVGVAAVAMLLIAQHVVVDPKDMSRINLAFFTLNSWVGLAVFSGTCADFWLRGLF